MRENFIEKVLMTIARASVGSTSWMGLYEPKVPEKLLKKKVTTSK